MSTLLKNPPECVGVAAGLAEAICHPAYGGVSAWINDAMTQPPSPGSLGRMELLRHWDRIPADKRRMLLLMAREMSRAETQ